MIERERYGLRWSTDELVLALALYCQIPFKKTKANNPRVIELARHLGRTPASVALKLGNFGAFDPTLSKQGISGLTHVSAGDRIVWERYCEKWSTLVDEADQLWPNQILPEVAVENDALLGGEGATFVHPVGPSEKHRLVKTRLHQAFFRRSVMASYNEVCCMCGLEIENLLVASHIIPWSQNEGLRADPTNGLCLCSIHDRAFDCGLISISASGFITTSSRLASFTSEACHSYLKSLEGRRLIQPTRFSPSQACLAWHRSNAFLN
jgi:hypothetical protein